MSSSQLLNAPGVKYLLTQHSNRNKFITLVLQSEKQFRLGRDFVDVVGNLRNCNVINIMI